MKFVATPDPRSCAITVTGTDLPSCLVTVYRYNEDGTSTVLRGAQNFAVTDGFFAVLDTEPYFNVDLKYIILVASAQDDPFQIQLNLISNPSFEIDTAGWTAGQFRTMSRIGTLPSFEPKAYSGNSVLGIGPRAYQSGESGATAYDAPLARVNANFPASDIDIPYEFSFRSRLQNLPDSYKTDAQVQTSAQKQTWAQASTNFRSWGMPQTLGLTWGSFENSYITVSSRWYDITTDLDDVVWDADRATYDPETNLLNPDGSFASLQALNYATNPRIGVDTSGYTLVNTGTASTMTRTANDLGGQLRVVTPSANTSTSINFTVNNLTPGRDYVASCSVLRDKSQQFWISAHNGADKSSGFGKTPSLAPTSTYVDVKIMYGNCYGGYDFDDKNYKDRIDDQAAFIASLGADVFAAVECHEDNDMHEELLKRIQKSDPGIQLYEGKSGNQLFYRASKYKPVSKLYQQMPGGRSSMRWRLEDRDTGFQFWVSGNHFRADDNNDTSRAKERLAQAKWLVNDLKDLDYVIMAGDFNSSTEKDGYPRAVFRDAGWLGMRERGPVVNGNLSTRSRSSSESYWIEDIFTRPQQSVSDMRLIKTNGLSDHNGWLALTARFTAKVVLPTNVADANYYIESLLFTAQASSETISINIGSLTTSQVVTLIGNVLVSTPNTDYFDGSLGESVDFFYNWTGATDASTSVRTPTTTLRAPQGGAYNEYQASWTLKAVGGAPMRIKMGIMDANGVDLIDPITSYISGSGVPFGGGPFGASAFGGAGTGTVSTAPPYGSGNYGEGLYGASSGDTAPVSDPVTVSTGTVNTKLFPDVWYPYVKVSAVDAYITFASRYHEYDYAKFTPYSIPVYARVLNPSNTVILTSPTLAYSTTLTWSEFRWDFTLPAPTTGQYKIEIVPGLQVEAQNTAWHIDGVMLEQGPPFSPGRLEYMDGSTPLPSTGDGFYGVLDSSNVSPYNDAADDASIYWAGTPHNSVSVFQGPSKFTVVVPARLNTGDAGVELVPDCEPIFLNDPTLPNSGGWFTLQAISELQYASRSSSYAILNRASPITISQRRSTPTTSISLITKDLPKRRALLDLLQSGRVIMLRNPDLDYPENNIYLSVSNVTESRLIADHRSPLRRFTLETTVVDRPGGIIVGGGAITWNLIDDVYQTWGTIIDPNSVAANVDTWEDLINKQPGIKNPINGAVGQVAALGTYGG